jgi:hypothetical protein
MPRTSLRYSIEKLTFEMRNRAMEKEVGSRKPEVGSSK